MADLLSLVPAILSGGLAVALFNWLTGRRRENTDYWHGEVIRLRNEVENLRKYHTEMDLVASSLRNEVIQWRQRYYDEQYQRRLNKEMFRAEIAALRAKGKDVSAEDIERLYTKLLLSVVEEVEDETEGITQTESL